MSQNFVPEMHDLGKLIKRDWRHLTTDGKALKVHTQKGPSFSNLNWEALKLKRLPFDNVTWLAIVYHMDKETKWVRDLALPPDIAISIEDRVRLFLTILADHLAATTGRALGKGERYEATEDTVYRLWHPKFAAALKPPVPITDEKKLCKAFELVRKTCYTELGGATLLGRSPATGEVDQAVCSFGRGISGLLGPRTS